MPAGAATTHPNGVIYTSLYVLLEKGDLAEKIEGASIATFIKERR